MQFKRIKDLREDNDLFQRDIANLLGISQQYYSEYESGKRTPPIDVLIRIANFLEVDFLWLIGMELEFPKRNNRIINLSEEDVKIIESLRKDSKLYEKFLTDPDRAIADISNQLKK